MNQIAAIASAAALILPVINAAAAIAQRPVQAAAGSCSTVLCWLDSHEGSAAWAAAVAGLLAAVATFCAVIVALCVARDGARRDVERRKSDQAQELKAVVTGIDYALVNLCLIFQELDDRVADGRESMPTHSTLKVLESCQSAIQYSLSRPFADEHTLRIALNTLTSIEVIFATFRRIQGLEPVGSAQVAELAYLFEGLRQTVESDRSTIRKLATDLGAG